MISEKQKQILMILLGNREGYKLGEIARILNIETSEIHETLNLLEKEKIVKLEKQNFRINWENKKAEELCEFLLIDSEKKPELEKNDEEKSDVTRVIEKELKEGKIIEQEKAPEITTYGIHNQAGNTTGSIYQTANTQGNAAPYQTANTTINNTNSFYNGGNQVNNVLGMYADPQSTNSLYGSNQGNSPGQYGSSGAANPGSIEATVSKTVGSYSYAQHTAHQNAGNVSGCKYCGTVI
ncbi:MAG: winged helix-turn-helix domain-containing protein [Nanoarchaeota archaeon]